MATTLNSAASLGEWLRRELEGTPPDVNHMLRVIARETDRWFLSKEAKASIPELTEQPVDTGDQRWNALLEGVVAYRMHIAGMSSPAWTRRTKLDVGWNPRDDSETPQSPQWALLDTFETPVEILEKGVTYSYRNMELA